MAQLAFIVSVILVARASARQYRCVQNCSGAAGRCLHCLSNSGGARVGATVPLRSKLQWSRWPMSLMGQTRTFGGIGRTTALES